MDAVSVPGNVYCPTLHRILPYAMSGTILDCPPPLGPSEELPQAAFVPPSPSPDTASVSTKPKQSWSQQAVAPYPRSVPDFP
eukprot:2761663-Rhodomonas_salina.1